jgi:hypothetical protein
LKVGFRLKGGYGKMRKLGNFEIILIVILIVFLLIAAIYYIPFLSSFDRREIRFTVEINNNSNDDFEILLPVPTTSRSQSYIEGLPIRLMDELTIEEDIECETILTENGWALQIKGKGSISIHGFWRENESSEQTLAQYNFDDISMKDKSNPGNYSIYYNSTNNSSTLKYQCIYKREHTDGKEHHEWGIANYIMQNGWQSTKLYIKSSDEGWI